jgi:hypothetical protein
MGVILRLHGRIVMLPLLNRLEWEKTGHRYVIVEAFQEVGQASSQ